MHYIVDIFLINLLRCTIPKTEYDIYIFNNCQVLWFSNFDLNVHILFLILCFLPGVNLNALISSHFAAVTGEFSHSGIIKDDSISYSTNLPYFYFPPDVTAAVLLLSPPPSSLHPPPPPPASSPPPPSPSARTDVLSVFGCAALCGRHLSFAVPQRCLGGTRTGCGRRRESWDRTGVWDWR